MKKFILSIFITVINFYATAQSPQGINYQGVAYDNTGNPVANQIVSIRFKILQGSASGPVLYEERQRPSTDNTGLFAVVIGNGTVLSGSFSSVNWDSGSKWLQTGIDITGGNNYIVMGCSQFWSVPYAFYADNATHSQYADSSLYATEAAQASHSVHADTAAYASNGGFSSGSFALPDGFKNVTTVVIDDSVNYIVPAGKNLYIPSLDPPVLIDNNKIYANFNGGAANIRTLVGAGENSTVWVFYSPIAAFLVDKSVEWKTFNLLATPFTVPAGKQFVIVNTVAESVSTATGTWGVYSTAAIPNQICKITLNNAPCTLTSNMVLAPGDIISSVGCPAVSNTIYYNVNGYLMDR